MFNNLIAMLLLLDDKTLNSLIACNNGVEVEESEKITISNVFIWKYILCLPVFIATGTKYLAMQSKSPSELSILLTI